MMRFGDFQSPILLEAFGDLCVAQDNQRLAARAYLLAAQQTGEMAGAAYEKIAKDSLGDAAIGLFASGSTQLMTLSDIQRFLKLELQEAKDWVANRKELVISTRIALSQIAGVGELRITRWLRGLILSNPLASKEQKLCQEIAFFRLPVLKRFLLS